jgi:hypothetical protein
MGYLNRMCNSILRMFSFFGVALTIFLLVIDGKYIFSGHYGGYLKLLLPLNFIIACYYFFNKKIKYSE